MALKDIDHIVFCMLENRSFDHMLGYLSLDGPKRMAVEGLRSEPAWRARYANLANGKSYSLGPLNADYNVEEDPPHGYDLIKKQIKTAPAGPGPTQMGGFVSTFLEKHKKSKHAGTAMGYYDATAVPTFDFFARNFCVCDHWFTPLPLGTQANRLMAMSGWSRIRDNRVPMRNQELVYDWLDAQKIEWRVYVWGGFAPFFLMMPCWSVPIARSLAADNGGRFNRYKRFRRDWTAEKTPPAVIFLEPEYGDAPGCKPNDDHPPAPISRGQDFLNDIYQTLTSNPERWARTLLIVTYDEHGGFFDHVPPLNIPGTAGRTQFDTTGPRVPAFLISPHVDPGKVFSEPLDHTSFLTLLDERFGTGQGYSAAVEARGAQLGRISNALRAEARTGAAPVLPKPVQKKGSAAAEDSLSRGPSAPDTPNAAAIDAMARELRAEHPEIFNKPAWKEMKLYLDTNPPPEPKHQDYIGPVEPR